MRSLTVDSPYTVINVSPNMTFEFVLFMLLTIDLTDGTADVSFSISSSSRLMGLVVTIIAIVSPSDVVRVTTCLKTPFLVVSSYTVMPHSSAHIRTAFITATPFSS